LIRLAELLGATAPVRTIEGIDIAHLGGQETCGSMVCFIDGKPFKSGYRRYRIKTAAGGDDFAAIREVVYRRYKHAGMNEELFPDVILIDGGRGQLSAAFSAFDELEFRPPRLISLAKREEEIFLHGRSEPLHLSRHDAALRLLQSVRDEAAPFRAALPSRAPPPCDVGTRRSARAAARKTARAGRRENGRGVKRGTPRRERAVVVLCRFRAAAEFQLFLLFRFFCQ